MSLTVILGQPATGKTTLRKAISSNTGAISLGIDDYRRQHARSAAWKAIVQDARKHLTNGDPVVIEGCRFTIPLHHLLAEHDAHLILCSAKTHVRRQRLTARGHDQAHIDHMLNEPPPTTRHHVIVDTSDDPDTPTLLARASA